MLSAKFWPNFSRTGNTFQKKCYRVKWGVKLTKTAIAQKPQTIEKVAKSDDFEKSNRKNS